MNADEPLCAPGSTRDDREPRGDLDDRAGALLERAAQGDRDAMLGLYDLLGPVLRAVALRVTSDPADAEDVLQDALVRAWSEAERFDRARGSAMTWLVTLTRNRAIDVVRARRRRNSRADEGAQLAAVGLFDTGTQPATDPEERASHTQRAAAVRAALAALSHEQRAVLDLAYFQGLSHSEIATALAQPLGTVKTRILLAVRKLRAHLEAYDERAEKSAAE